MLPTLLFLIGLSDVPQALPTGTLVERVSCRSDPAQTYTLYLPSGYDATHKRPLLLIFDPRGRGTQAAEIFRDAAERFGWIIASSNNTSSDGDWEPNRRALAAMWPDIRRSYAVDERRIYAAGFSGGATVASVLAQSTSGIAGIIGVGAPDAPNAKLQSKPVAWFGAAGRTDFNFLDMKRIDERIGRAGVPHRLELFDGGHRWLPASLAMRALAWFEMLGMEEARRPKDHDLANTLITEEIEYARGLETTGLLADAERVYDSIVTYFGGLADTSSAVSRRSALVKDERFRAAQRDELRIDARERSTLNEISRTLKGLFEPEPPLPAQLIAMLRIEALKKEARGKGYEAAAAARTLELLSVQTSFYMPRDFERQKDHDRAARALEIAAAIRPDRPGVWLGLAANRVKALQMAPGFPEALEYRAEPYLALNRVDEAKNAYLELFASDRKQAAILIRALRDWVEKRRVAPEGPERPIDAVSFAASPACRATFPPGSRKNTECAFQWRGAASRPGLSPTVGQGRLAT